MQGNPFMQDALSLVQLLKNFTSERPDQAQVNRLIEYCWRLAAILLRQRYGSGNLIFNSDSISHEDTAIDAIAPLFSGEKPGLKTSLEQWPTKLVTEGDAAWFLHRLLMRRVSQQVGILLKEQNPVFARVLKLVNYYVSVNDWAKVSHFGTLFIVESGTAVITGRIIDSDNFGQIPEQLFSGTIVQVIQNLFEFIHNFGEYFPAIPVYLLVHRLEVQYVRQPSTNSTEPDQSFEVDEIFRKGLDQTLQRLSQIYLEKSKLSHEEGRLLGNAFREIVQDMQDGGVNQSLLEYLRKSIPDLEPAEFYRRYRPVMEYLMRMMKNTLREAWQEA